MIVNLALAEHKPFMEAFIETLTHRLGPNWPNLFFNLSSFSDDHYTLIMSTAIHKLHVGPAGNCYNINMTCTNQAGHRMLARSWDKHQKYYGSKVTALEVQRLLQKSVAKASGKGTFFCAAASAGAVRYVVHSHPQVVSLVCHAGANFNMYAEAQTKNKKQSEPFVLAILSNITNRAKAGSYYNAEIDRGVWASLVAQGATHRIAKSKKEPTPALVELLQGGTFSDADKAAEMPKPKKPRTFDEAADESFNNIMNRIHQSLEVDAMKYQKLKEQEAKVLESLRVLQDQQEVICKKWMQITGGDNQFVVDSLNSIVTYNKS